MLVLGILFTIVLVAGYVAERYTAARIESARHDVTHRAHRARVANKESKS